MLYVAEIGGMFMNIVGPYATYAGAARVAKRFNGTVYKVRTMQELLQEEPWRRRPRKIRRDHTKKS